MEKNKLTFAVAMFILSGYYLYNAIFIPTGSPSEPGPGFFPIILGVVAVAVALTLIISSLASSRRERTEKGCAENKANREGFKRITWYIIMLVIIIASFELIGAVISIFALTLILAKISGQKGWLTPVLLGLCCSLGLYIVFNMLFDIYLPPGLLAFIL